ncbi:MAG TPA: hypothetical protein DDZ39_10905 [Flavobacteriaceae bacterium]|jgi:hypothetical protein|nr:hypothetical protein [Flavobacteriaceae bacterium]HBS11469.1 hypothetical protein [Flavobacteriaceae bacterium]
MGINSAFSFVNFVYVGALEGKNENTGRRLFVWSGWSALFNEKDFELKINIYPKVKYNGINGPYIVGEKVLYVNSQNKLVSSLIKNPDSLLVKVNNND